MIPSTPREEATALRRVAPTVFGRHAITFLGLLFVVLAGVLAYVLASANSPRFDVFVAFSLSAGPGVILVYRSYRLPDTDIDPELYPLIAAWCFAGAVVTAATLWLYHVQPAAGRLTEPPRIILNIASLSAIAGYGIGFYDARARTRTSELEEYERMVETVGDGVYVLDARDRFHRVNDAFVSMTEYDRSALLGTHASAVFGQTFQELDREARQQFESDEMDVAAFEETIYTAEEEPITVESRFRPFEVEEGRGRVGVVRDITERKEREQQLEQFERIVATLDDGVYVTDNDGDIVFVNDAFVSMSRYTREELLGAHGSVFFGDEFVDTDEEQWRELVDGDRDSIEFETEVVGPNGEARVVHNQFVPLEIDDEVGRVGVTRDVTELKQYQRELEESNERLEQFAYVASHDLQEPLRMISSYLQLLDDRYAEALDEDAEEFIAFAVDGAERMREMIDDLLAYSRVDTEAEPLEPTESETVVENALRNLERQIEETDAEIEVGSLPTVHADRNQLEQLFQNLVSNALKYSGDDPPEVEISAEREGEGWVFRVADDGIGMDPDEADRIFDVFERLHADEEYQGTGIGLALCQKIVDRHGGDIWVESEPGDGSTFYFTLLDPDHPRALGDQANGTVTAAGGGGVRWPGSGGDCARRD